MWVCTLEVHVCCNEWYCFDFGDGSVLLSNWCLIPTDTPSHSVSVLINIGYTGSLVLSLFTDTIIPLQTIPLLTKYTKIPKCITQVNYPFTNHTSPYRKYPQKGRFHINARTCRVASVYLPPIFALSNLHVFVQTRHSVVILSSF